jgi:hypothetical protein
MSNTFDEAFRSCWVARENEKVSDKFHGDIGRSRRCLDRRFIGMPSVPTRPSRSNMHPSHSRAWAFKGSRSMFCGQSASAGS